MLKPLLFIPVIACAVFVGRCVRWFLQECAGPRSIVPYILIYATICGPMWVGDENPLFFFVAYLLIFILCYRGTLRSRLAVGVMFYCILTPLCVMVDTQGFWDVGNPLGMMCKAAPLALAFLLIRQLVPNERVKLSDSLWGLICMLLLAPLFGILSFSICGVVWRDIRYIYYNVFDYPAFIVLPFVMLSALAVMYAAILLSRHEVLEESNRLAELREVYYKGIQQEQKQVRKLRHDMRNHMVTLQGFISQGKIESASGYITELTHSPALQSTLRFCENETANVVLASKSAEMEREGLEADFSVALPENLKINGPELAALIGNALDNAIEAARDAEDKRITIQARADKGMLMMRVSNAFTGARQDVNGSFPTTKPDKRSHGFGLEGIRELASRMGGTMDISAGDGRFELIVCLPLDSGY